MGCVSSMMSTTQYLTLFILCDFLIDVNGILNVTIMVYGMRRPSDLQSLAYTAPGFELGAEAVNTKFADVLSFQLEFVSSGSVLQCPDMAANYHEIAERYYDIMDGEARLLAVFYPGCDSSTTLADFGREWNMLTVNMGATFSNLRDRIAYPTAIALGPFQYEIYGVMIGQLTAAYNWTSIALIYDVSHGAMFHPLLAEQIRRYMRQTYGHVEVHPFPVDTRENINFLPVIREISVLSRVVIFAIPTSTAQMFWVAFAEAGESSEEYIQIYLDDPESPLLQNFAHSSTKGAAEHWQPPFIITVCFEHGDKEIIKLKRMLKERTTNVYDATFRDDGEPSEFAITAYTSLLIYAQVLNETISVRNDPHDGSRMAQSMLNRTFTFPAVGSIYIDKDGERQNIICLYNFQPGSQRYEKVRYFDSATQTLGQNPNVSVVWGTPENVPPPNEPTCGFRKDRPPCLKMGSSTLGGMICAILLAGIVLWCTLPAIFRRMRKQAVDENWWMVDLHYLSRAVESGSSEISGRSHPFSYKSNVLINAPMNYRGMPVWAKVVQISRRTVPLHSPHGAVNVGPEFRGLLSEMRILALRCPNINPLVGIGLGPIRLTYLTALCPRGNLGGLIEDVSLDWGLKCSLIADIVEVRIAQPHFKMREVQLLYDHPQTFAAKLSHNAEPMEMLIRSGVAAIHRTMIRRHGHLRPSKCLIDSRLVLRINEVGLYDTLSELQVELINPKNFEAIGQSLDNAWVAPELRIDLIESATFASIAPRAEPSADVYAVAGLVSYVLQDHKYDKDEKLIDFAHSTKHGIPTSAVPALATLLYQCRNGRAADRPNIWQVKVEIDRILGSPGRLLNGLVKRLEDYALHLENAVALRTHTLKQEMEKCDALLGEMLPRYVLVQLRIGHLVQPQIFHSVTLLMTHVAGFHEFVIKHRSNPLEIVMFLNTMFTMLDRILVTYDCYKAGTVTDSCLVVSGLPVENAGEHVHTMAALALEVRDDFEKAFSTEGLRAKAGLHTGPCAAGVVGTAQPRYCVFGDSVTLTLGLACSSKPGKIHTSYATEALLTSDAGYQIIPRGMTYLKGVGSIMTFWLDG